MSDSRDNFNFNRLLSGVKQFSRRVLKMSRLCFLSTGARLRQFGYGIRRLFRRDQADFADEETSLPKKLLRTALNNILWIWAIAIAAGIIIFKLTAGGLPGMASHLVFTTWWEDELPPDTLQRLVTAFMEKNPDIQVKLKKMGRDELRELLADEDKREDAGDIISVDSWWLPSLEAGSLLAPLAAAAGEDGRYGLPLVSFINPLYYNIRLLREAGFDRPPKTLAELLACAQRVSNAPEGIAGAALSLDARDGESVPREILSWIWNSAGVPAENAEGAFYADYRFTSKQALPAFEFLNQLRGSLYLDPFTLSARQKLDAFKAGKIGMINAPSCALKELPEAEFGVTTIPAPTAYMGKSVFSLSSWYVGVNALTAKQEEAETFIRYLRDNAGVIAAAAGAIPGNGRRNPDMAKESVNYVKMFDMYDAGEMVRNRPPLASELNAAVRTAVGRMFAGGQTPAEAAAAVQAAWEEVIR
ncbi:MAG: extracellular solute-binding protein [Treponema sp.]|nr:extracellular solute-binding protein [Treponema sp.]